MIYCIFCTQHIFEIQLNNKMHINSKTINVTYILIKLIQNIAIIIIIKNPYLIL